MSKRNWGILAALAGIGALCTASGFGAYYGSIYAPEKRHYQSIGPNSGQTYPADSPRNGLADVSGIDSLIQSTIAKPQPRNADERQDRDLAAQESMAVFAYWMFWAMMLQTALAGGALWMLIRDLRQNKISAETQLRAYVFISRMVLVQKGDGLLLAISFSNSGSTPCKNLVAQFQALDFDKKPITSPKRAEIGSLPPGIPMTRQFGVLRGLLSKAKSRSLEMAWEVRWSYDDGFGHTRSGRVVITSEPQQLPRGEVGTTTYEID